MFQSEVYVSIDSLVGFGGDGLTWHLESYRRYREREREQLPSSDSFPKQNSICRGVCVKREKKRKREKLRKDKGTGARRNENDQES